MNFVDALEIEGTRRREDGALIVNARVARTGIQDYRGFEVDKPDIPVVKVFRDAATVFDRASLATFAHRPVTVDHPPEMVTADNWRQYAVGQTADEVAGEGVYVRVPLMVSDASAITAIEGGKRELSVGYSCDLDWTPGITADGTEFHARQKNIRVNHIAIVERGRAGPQVRIGDSWTMENPNMTLKTITFDGLPIEVTPQAEAVITRLVADRDRLSGELTTVKTTSATEIATRDAKIGELTAEVTRLKSVDHAKLARDRAALETSAKAIFPAVVTDGKSDAEIRRQVVDHKMPNVFAADASADVVEGAFRALTPAPTQDGDPFADAMRRAGPPSNPVDNGQAKYEKRLTDAWKTAGTA